MSSTLIKGSELVYQNGVVGDSVGKKIEKHFAVTSSYRIALHESFSLSDSVAVASL